MRGRWLLLGFATALLAACSRPAPPAGELTGSPPPPRPDFNMVVYQGESTLGGREIAFSGVLDQGKPVVLNFWAGQCPPCRAEMPDFQRVADEFEGRVIFLGLDVGPFTGLGSHEDAQRLLQELGVRYPTAYALDASSIEMYRVASMPSTIFFRRGGEIESRRPGAMSESELRREVEKLVGA